MSRNSKLREVAAKLPPINKIGKNGRYMYDRHGQPIKVDHFQAMCDLKNALPEFRLGSKKVSWEAHHKAEIQIIGRYTRTVMLMVRKRRDHRIAMFLKWTSFGISVGATILYLWYKHH